MRERERERRRRRRRRRWKKRRKRMRGDGSSIQRSVFVISLLNQFHHLHGFIWIRENLQQITPWRRTAFMFPHGDRSRSDTLQQGDEKATFQWVKSSTRMQKLVLTNPLLMYVHVRSRSCFHDPLLRNSLFSINWLHFGG
uniref:Uncharacterized protein n=1 Tax=Oryza barthii TaxID=65489 RepID=A0A0D3FN13_9ORYZ